jgi:hypothetical protein
MKECKNCKWFKWTFFRKHHCAIHSLYYSGKGKQAITSQCEKYKRKWWKFWVKKESEK